MSRWMALFGTPRRQARNRWTQFSEEQLRVLARRNCPKARECYIGVATREELETMLETVQEDQS